MAQVKSAAPAASANAPSSRYIPGAPSTTATSKTKSKRKKQAGGDAAAPTNGVTASPVTTKSETPVALLSQVPSVSDLPSELVGAGSGTEGKDESIAPRPKSAAEEMVQKRMKLLAKKIQRFKAYKEKDESTLNQDQVAAIASLPALEAAYRELDDVSKALESVEIEQEKQRAESASQVETRIDVAKVEAVQAYKVKVLPLIASLVGLHSTLHPRDNTASSFIPPVLPPHLQDISAEDVKKVDAMYETISKGDIEAVDGLFVEVETIKGSFLYNVFIGNASDSSAPADDDAAPIFSPKIETTAVPDVANGTPETAESDFVPKFGSFEVGSEVADEPVARDIAAVSSVPAQMTFMQSSELEESVPSKTTETAPQENAAVVEEAPVAAPAPFNVPALDWTVEDDDDMPTAQNLQDTFALGSEPTTSGFATPAAAPPAQPEPVKEAPPQGAAPVQRDSANHQGGRRGARQGQHGPANGKTARQASNRQPNVDEDGFQVAQRKGRGGPSEGQTPGFRGGRGRGGPGGGGERGRGGFRGRGGPDAQRGIRRGYAARPENVAV